MIFSQKDKSQRGCTHIPNRNTKLTKPTPTLDTKQPGDQFPSCHDPMILLPPSFVGSSCCYLSGKGKFHHTVCQQIASAPIIVLEAMGFTVAGICVGTPESLSLETIKPNLNVPEHMHRHIGTYRYIDANIRYSTVCTVQDSTIQCNALRYVTSRYITLHCITLRYITYTQYITSHHITTHTLHYLTSPFHTLCILQTIFRSQQKNHQRSPTKKQTR